MSEEKAASKKEGPGAASRRKGPADSPSKSKGVGDRAVRRWEKVIERSGLTPAAVQSELVKAQSLSRLEGRTQARVEKARQALEKLQAKHDELRKKYSSAWDSVTRYQLLREEGVDGTVLQRWEELIVGNGLDPGKVEDELVSLKSLDRSRKELEGRNADLEAKGAAAGEHLKVLEGELAKLELQRAELAKSIDAVSRGVQSATEGAAEAMGRVRDEAGGDIRKASEDAKAELAATAAALDGFRAKIEEAYASAVKTGETIGKYEALRPLVKFVESGEGKPGEVIPLMALLARTLAKWAKDGDPILQARAQDLEAYLDEKLRMA